MPLKGIFRNLSTFKMKLFSRIVDGKKSLIVAKKTSITDVLQGPKRVSVSKIRQSIQEWTK